MILTLQYHWDHIMLAKKLLQMNDNKASQIKVIEIFGSKTKLMS